MDRAAGNNTPSAPQEGFDLPWPTLPTSPFSAPPPPRPSAATISLSPPTRYVSTLTASGAFSQGRQQQVSSDVWHPFSSQPAQTVQIAPRMPPPPPHVTTQQSACGFSTSCFRLTSVQPHSPSLFSWANHYQHELSSQLPPLCHPRRLSRAYQSPGHYEGFAPCAHAHHQAARPPCGPPLGHFPGNPHMHTSVPMYSPLPPQHGSYYSLPTSPTLQQRFLPTEQPARRQLSHVSPQEVSQLCPQFFPPLRAPRVLPQPMTPFPPPQASFQPNSMPRLYPQLASQFASHQFSHLSSQPFTPLVSSSSALPCSCITTHVSPRVTAAQPHSSQPLCHQTAASQPPDAQIYLTSEAYCEPERTITCVHNSPSFSNASQQLPVSHPQPPLSVCQQHICSTATQPSLQARPTCSFSQVSTSPPSISNSAAISVAPSCSLTVQLNLTALPAPPPAAQAPRQPKSSRGPKSAKNAPKTTIKSQKPAKASTSRASKSSKQEPAKSKRSESRKSRAKKAVPVSTEVGSDILVVPTPPDKDGHGDVEIGEQVVEVEASDPEEMQVYVDFVKHFKSHHLKLGYCLEDIVQQVAIRYRERVSLQRMKDFEELLLQKDSYAPLMNILTVWMKDTARASGSEDILMLPTTSIYPFREWKQKRKQKTLVNITITLRLEEEFSKRKSHTPAELQKLAFSLGVDKEYVKNWFYNRRRKEKAMDKKLAGKEEDTCTVTESNTGASDAVLFPGPMASASSSGKIPSMFYDITVEVPSIHPRDIISPDRAKCVLTNSEGADVCVSV